MIYLTHSLICRLCQLSSYRHGIWLVATVFIFGCAEPDPKSEPITATKASYVGSAECTQCHEEQVEQWQDSHHAKAMQPLHNLDLPEGGVYFESDHLQVRVSVNQGSVQRPGQPDLPIKYGFGHTPLLQFLVESGEGRLQVLDPAWQTRSPAQWLTLYPDATDPHDPLHWEQPGQNWNFMCADCHVTGLDKGYSRSQRVYETTFVEPGVGCESCHGPASNHVARAQGAFPGSDTYGLVQSERTDHGLLNTCAPCHSRREQLAQGFSPDKQYLDHYSPVLLDESLYHPDGQILDEVYVYGSFLQSRMHAAGVQCSDCHNSHSGRLIQAGNDLCTTCHSPAGNPRFPSLTKKVYDTDSHHFHGDDSTGSMCVNCHMPSKVYMAIDARRDHSFRVPRPDLSISVGVPNACSQCHTDKDVDWAVAALAERGVQPAPHFANAVAAGRRREPEAESVLSVLLEDRSIPPIIRATAASLLSGYANYGSSRILADALRDSSPLVRMGALHGAQRWSAAERWRRVQPLLDDPLRSVRTQAVRTLLPVYQQLDSPAQQALDPYLDAYLASMTLQQDRAEGLTNMALVYQVRGDIAGAERDLTEATQINPNWLPAWLNLADLYRRSGRDLQAGALLDSALSRAPEQPQLLLGKALWLVRQGSRNEALPLLEQAWKNAGAEGQYAYVYAVALHDAGRSREALDLLTASLSEHAESGHADAQQLRTLAMSIARDSGDMEAVMRLLAVPD